MTKRDLPRCLACGAVHDPRPCAAGGSACDCCGALYRDQEARVAACVALDGEVSPELVGDEASDVRGWL